MKLAKTSREEPMQDRPLRFLAYALPRAKNDFAERRSDCHGFTLYDVPLNAHVSFLDYDGVILVGGAYEHVQEAFTGSPQMVCLDSADLDLRERQWISALDAGKTLIFLIKRLPEVVGYHRVDEQVDLFRRIAAQFGIAWASHPHASPLVESLAVEFQEYVKHFGTGYVFFDQQSAKNFSKPLCRASDRVYGLVLGDRAFFLPCPVPKTQAQLLEIVSLATEAAIAFRRRVARDLPAWAGEFVFSREGTLRRKLLEAEKLASKLEGEVATYTDLKAALSLQSDPLVETVQSILNRFFDLSLKIDDRCIEDATLLDDGGAILAVFEIKGVKANFARKDVSQVDAHRERLELPSTTPGILIMNTMMGAKSLKEKDEPPHPDIIEKAVRDNVLLARTLDLLRFVDGVERGIFKAADLRALFLNEAGWLQVDADRFQVVKRRGAVPAATAPAVNAPAPAAESLRQASARQ